LFKDLGLIDFDEPFTRLLTQGMVLKEGDVMSKSRGNTVDPDEIISRYGADSLRLCILFAAPPEDPLEWNDGAVDGSWKFLARLWHTVKERYTPFEGRIDPQQMDKEDKDIERARHTAIKKVTEDIAQGYKFNTAISGLMILLNRIDKYDVSAGDSLKQGLLNQAMQTMVLLLAPFTPHICEELWQKMGGREDSIMKAAWPSYEERALEQDMIQIVAQVNGKLRGKFDVPAGISEEEVKELVLSDEKIREFMQGKPLRRFVYVPGKLANIVV
jgi:leucyl-tRNA synthetase